MTREVPPLIDEAVLRGTVKLRWQLDRVSELVVRWDPNLSTVGDELFSWAATEALDALWLDGASLFRAQRHSPAASARFAASVSTRRLETSSTSTR